MDTRYSIRGRLIGASDKFLQDALARIHDSPERPRCMCVPGGIDMYIAKHGEYVVKRMPGTGHLHHPSCVSFEPDVGESGLGELMGQAIVVSGPETLELKIDFPLTRTVGKSSPRSEPVAQPAVVKASQKRASLRALLHLLYDRAEFNRWYPSMQGKRSWGVVHHYLQQAAKGVTINGLNLEERLFVPEPFRAAQADEIAQRRRRRLSILQKPEAGVSFKMAVVVGQFASVEDEEKGVSLTLKHMPDVQLFLEEAVWTKATKAYGRLLQALKADITPKPRVLVAAVIYAKRELTYQIASMTMMLTTDQWVPLEGVHEVALIETLQRHGRAFYKPLQFDAKSSAPYMNAKLLDTAEPTPMHVISAFSSDEERKAKTKAISECSVVPWVWETDEPMPPLPLRGVGPAKAATMQRNVAAHEEERRGEVDRGNRSSTEPQVPRPGLVAQQRQNEPARETAEEQARERMHQSALAALQSGPSMAEQEDAPHEPLHGSFDEDWNAQGAAEH